MNAAREDNPTEADASAGPHGDRADDVDLQGGEDVLPGVARGRRPGESAHEHALRLMREFAVGQVAQERAGRRFSCSVCMGRLEDRCALFEASRAIRRTDPRSGRVGYLGPRWWLCRPCAGLVRRGGWPQLVDRAGKVDEMRSEVASIVVELEQVLSPDGRVVQTPRYGGAHD